MKLRQVGTKVLFMSYAVVLAVFIWQKMTNHLNPENAFRWEDVPLVGVLMDKGWAITDVFNTDYSFDDEKVLEIPLSIDLMKDMVSNMHPKASPFALLIYRGLYYIDEKGYLVCPADDLSLDLPVITGSAFQIDVEKWRFAGDDMRDVLEFLRRIQRMNPVFFSQISEAHISAEFGIIVHTSLVQGIPLILGKGAMERKARYITAFIDQMEDSILLDNVKYMDLRMEGQIILKKNG